jgi:hypothetical protein
MADLKITIEFRIPVPDEVKDYDEGRFAELLDEICDATAFAAEAEEADVKRWDWRDE